MKTPLLTLAGTALAVLLTGTPGWAATGSVNDPAIGWASQNGGTTGGKGGTEVTVTTMADLQKYAKDSKPYIIWVKGTIGSYGTRGAANGDRVVLSSNKSILGLPGAHIKGGFDLNGVKNVILRNLTVEGPGAVDKNGASAGEDREDAITLVNGTTNVWMDHLEVFDGEDGNADITKKSNFVTLSWCKFRYTSKSEVSGKSGYSHRFCNLIGGDDGEGSEGTLNLTFFKCWWGEGVAERMPRVRFGKVHVANSLFNSTDAGQNHCVRAGYKADLLVESNVFIGQKKPIDLYDGDYTAVTAKNNIFTNCSGNTAGNKTAFTPPYSLSLSAASAVQAEVSDAKNGAGATLTWSTTGLIDRSTEPTGWRLDLDKQGWILANTSTAANKVSIRDLVGRQLESFTLAAGASVNLSRSGVARFARIESETGASRVVAIPGL